MSVEVLVYLFDIFHKTDLKKEDVLQAFKEDKKKPFELVRTLVEEQGVKGIRKVEFQDALVVDDDFLIEYLVESNDGMLTVKLIAFETPRKMVMRYYEYLRGQAP